MAGVGDLGLIERLGSEADWKRRVTFVEGPIWRYGDFYVNCSKGSRYPKYCEQVLLELMTLPVIVRTEHAAGRNDPERWGHDDVECVAQGLGLPFDVVGWEPFEVPVESTHRFVKSLCSAAAERIMSAYFMSACGRFQLKACQEADLHVESSDRALFARAIELASNHKLRYPPPHAVGRGYMDAAAVESNLRTKEGRAQRFVRIDISLQIRPDKDLPTAIGAS